jgi:response regulator of citrate/malate metabolism
MVTANVDEDLGRELLKRGAFDYIMKPFDRDQLDRALTAALGGGV